MTSESDEMQVNYFVLCDQVITEAQTHKQSLIGVYSALMGEQFPLMANLAVGIGVRVQSARRREMTLRLSGPDNEMIFASPPLPCAWESVEGGLRASGFATLQIGLNLRAVPFQRAGVYTAALFCDGSLLATYPISVLQAQPGQPGQSLPPAPGVG
ncbi:MAG TPA: hypothetical protein VKT32_03925 [Chthonomonadaceae bacterium]|nr:hypothetical protein [Chthonomonadaceae bacterium]